MYVIPVETALRMKEILPHEQLLADGTLQEFNNGKGSLPSPSDDCQVVRVFV